MLHCGQCQKSVEEHAAFCGWCGAPLAGARDGAAADLYGGRTIHGYKLVRRIGGGGMGEVYRAIHLKLGVARAIKVLKPELQGHPDMVQRFKQEARAVSMLDHPNIIHLNDFLEGTEGTLFMVMDYVEGASLADVIQREGELGEAAVIEVGAQLLSALSAAHAAGVVHRDLKPGNVMLKPRRGAADEVIVLDFGIAKIRDPGGGGFHTRTGEGLGTPSYMSPEQVNGGSVDGRSDLYAVGVILYEMLTGKTPVEDADLAVRALGRGPRFLPPSRHRKSGPVSPALDALILRALSKSPAGRPASAEAMRAELLACEPVAPPRPISQSPRSAAWFALAFALGVAAPVPASAPPPTERIAGHRSPPSPPPQDQVLAPPEPQRQAEVAPEPVQPPSRPPDRKQAQAGRPVSPQPRPVQPPPPARPACRHGVAEHRGGLAELETPLPESGFGILEIVAAPHGRVWLDGVSHGEAPRVFKLCAGNYRLQIVHPDQSKNATVHVPAGVRLRCLAKFPNTSAIECGPSPSPVKG